MPHKGDPLTQCKNWSYSVSYSPRTNLRWDLKLRCLTEGGRSLGSLTHAHSRARTLITPSTTAVMTSDWWRQWRWHVLRKYALGHIVRVSFVVSFLSSLHCSTSWSTSCRLLAACACCTGMLGEFDGAPRWLDTCGGCFKKGGGSGWEAGCSCWCSHVFFSVFYIESTVPH